MIHVVVGIVFNSQGEVLLAQREPQKFQGGRWEFPGGKVEATETPLEALKRELFEEIGISVVECEGWHQVEHQYADREILLDVWLVNAFNGEPHGKEGQKICWIDPKNLFTLSIPDANIPIVNKLISRITS